MCERTLPADEWKAVLDYIHRNDFEDRSGGFNNPLVLRLLSFYVNNRKNIVESDTELYIMKKEYDNNPTIKGKRRNHNE